MKSEFKLFTTELINFFYLDEQVINELHSQLPEHTDSIKESAKSRKDKGFGGRAGVFVADASFGMKSETETAIEKNRTITCSEKAKKLVNHYNNNDFVPPLDVYIENGLISDGDTRVYSVRMALTKIYEKDKNVYDLNLLNEKIREEIRQKNKKLLSDNHIGHGYHDDLLQKTRDAFSNKVMSDISLLFEKLPMNLDHTVIMKLGGGKMRHHIRHLTYLLSLETKIWFNVLGEIAYVKENEYQINPIAVWKRSGG